MVISENVLSPLFLYNLSLLGAEPSITFYKVEDEEFKKLFGRTIITNSGVKPQNAKKLAA